MAESSLECPHCATGMERVVEPDLSFDRCPGCSGLYLDRGGLNALATSLAGDIEFCSTSTDGMPESSPPRLCPRCPGQPMQKKGLLIYSALVFDFCENCKGWFLDRGEVLQMNHILRELREAQHGQAEYRARHHRHLVTINEFTATEVAEYTSVQTRWMRVEVYSTKPWPEHVTVTPEKWAARLQRLFGLRECLTGDAEFDHTFVVSGDAASLAGCLTPSVRRAILEAYRSPHLKVGKKRTFEIREDRIIFGYSNWGNEQCEPSRSQRDKLIETLVDLAVVMDGPRPSTSRENGA